MKYKLLMLLVLYTMISSCSFIQEEKRVLHLSTDGKLIDSTNEVDKPEEIEEAEDADEPAEPDITNPMQLREMSAHEMPLREMQAPEMQLREMPLRDN